MRKLLAGLAAFALAAGLGACGEAEEVVVFKQGKYQGKPDTKAWDNAPVAAELGGASWTQGDRASWETAMRARQLAQHEHKRIYQK
jgi:hypothetical protein